jgi:hypothetical protein
MIIPAKEKIIFGFKILSILLISFILIYCFNSMKNEEITNFNIKKETQKEKETKFKQIFQQKKIYSFCEYSDSSDKNPEAEISKNSYAYYSFAIILGAFINSKKIMKIGII